MVLHEATGLEPEEIVSIRHTLSEYHKETDPLLRAKVEGRLVVLDEPKRPLVWGDDNHDTVLCPRCLCDLMGGFEFAPDSDTQMFQCPRCGQPIDSYEVIAFEEAEAALAADINVGSKEGGESDAREKDS